jgi:hypothetical protein
MSDYSISIPDALLVKAQRIAHQTARHVDDVLLTRLQGALDEPIFDLPDDEKAELTAMAYLSDDALWTIAREQMPRTVHDRMVGLMANNTRGTISADEYAELAELVERGNQLTLRKAQAVKYLTGRGYRVSREDLKPAHE